MGIIPNLTQSLFGLKTTNDSKAEGAYRYFDHGKTLSGMISRKNVIRIFISVNIVCWLLLLAVNLITLFGLSSDSTFGVPVYVRGLLLNLFLIITFFYYRTRIDEYDESNFIDLLSQVLLTGCLSVLISLLLQIAAFLLGEDYIIKHTQITLLFYHIHIGLVTIFLTKAFFIWKKLVLYRKSRKLLLFWNFFEYAMLASLFLNFFKVETASPTFRAAFLFLAIYGLFLSVNLKWVAYLSMKEKWQSILLILLIGLFSVYFIRTLDSYSTLDVLITSSINSVFILGFFAFTLIYCVFSVLVILFSLPTSSVFEQKLEEVLNFQKLTQSVQMGRNEKQVYETLLEGTSKVTSAEAAWLEITSNAGETSVVLYKNVEPTIVEEIKKLAKTQPARKPFFKPLMRSFKKETVAKSTIVIPFRSFLTIPLFFQDKKLGSLTLLKKERDGFNKDTVEVANTFARVAGVAIENFRLLSNVLETERYREALAIAQKVQQKLLPQQLTIDPQFDVHVLAQSAEEVGGDFYDFYKTSENQTTFVIGDVSGKGVSAAFHMAQMKGVFQSLSELNLPLEEFLSFANRALSRCLDKDHFITATFFTIESSLRKICIARAGHCPTLHFCNQTKKSSFLQEKGLGLGVLRNNDYAQYVTIQELYYASGDAILLYTDGLIEARNEQNEEYGYDRLLHFLDKNYNLPSEQFVSSLMQDLSKFCNTAYITDDLTVMIIKFT